MELPSCPVCIEKLDGSITGIYFEIMNKTFAYDKNERWLKMKDSCPVCSKIKLSVTSTNTSNLPVSLQNTQHTDGLSCDKCGQKENIWICLICSNVGCGRYKSAHAHDHYTLAKHSLSLEIESHRYHF